MVGVVKEETQAISGRFGDGRRTEIIDEEAEESAFVPLAGAAVEHLLTGKKPPEVQAQRNDNRWKLASRPSFYWRKW